MKKLIKCLLCFFIITTPLFGNENNWPNWRGPNNNGSVTSGAYPIKWNLESDQVIWKIDIPGKGFSTPIVWDKKIYLTTGTEDLDTVLAFDWSGNLIWKKQLGPEKEGKHKNGSGSNPSAITDGNAIFVFFKSGNFAAINLDGSIRWKFNLFKNYGKDERYWDFGTSPVLTNKYVVMAEMHDGESWLAAFDKITGKLKWKVPRNYETAKEGSQAYTTPIVFSTKGNETLLVWGAHHLTAHDANEGEIIWSCGNFNPDDTQYWLSAASPVISEGVAVVPCGRADKRRPRLHGIKIDGTGDVTETHRLWKRNDIGTFVPTPAEYKERVYIISDRGEVNCINPLTGEDIWSGIFPKGKGNFYSSPLIANDHLYAAREDGKIFVIKLEDKFEIISEINMEDKIIASPIAISDRLLVRTDKYLYCIGSK